MSALIIIAANYLFEVIKMIRLCEIFKIKAILKTEGYT